MNCIYERKFQFSYGIDNVRSSSAPMSMDKFKALILNQSYYLALNTYVKWLFGVYDTAFNTHLSQSINHLTISKGQTNRFDFFFVDEMD